MGQLSETDPENLVIWLTTYPKRLDVFGMLFFDRNVILTMALKRFSLAVRLT